MSPFRFRRFPVRPLRRALGLLLLLPLAAACGRAEGASRYVIDTLPGGTVRVTNGAAAPAPFTLVERQRVAPPDGSPAELAQPQSLAVDEQGRVYVAEARPPVIKVYDRDGALLRTIGRDGEGPGEFRVAFIATGRGHLVVHDPRLSRTSVFDTAGTFVRSWPSACCYWSRIYVDSAGRIAVPSPPVLERDREREGTAWLRYTLEGQPVDTLFVAREGESRTAELRRGKQLHMVFQVPLTPSGQHTLTPDGSVVRGFSDRFQLTISRSGEDTVRLFTREWQAEPLTDSLYREVVESMVEGFGPENSEGVRDALSAVPIPKTLPAFAVITTDQAGRIWVAQHEPDNRVVRRFDVFEPSGIYLGQVTSPVPLPRYGAIWFGASEVVAVIEDEDGVPVLVRLGLKH